MKRALISPNEIVQDGQRIAQVVELTNEFPVALPLHWIDCIDTVKAETHYYDGTLIQLIPAPLIQPPSQYQLDQIEAKSKADELISDTSLPLILRIFVASLRKIL